ncbi:MAG: UvrD-helicase domain-containing protein [Firmicutes bacterium]|nr:UvrD-helicase domain-containing protein [Bacillota bacterium]MCL1953320.1 UvrD-helicase domain-containing protein [Bacillota bacterium]
MNFDINTLNTIQREICLHTDGAILVIAGAGSGKTRTLTHRIAHLVNNHNIPAYNILAITFTNKATEEMKNRLSSLNSSENLWIFTFHGLCLRILKKGCESIGYKKGFSIYGDSEKKALIKRIIKDSKYEDDILKDANYYIGDAKSKSISPENFELNYSNIKYCETIQAIYLSYQDRLKQCNALDFDDMLTKAYQVLTVDNDTRQYFSDKFRYIHVDEFQDTNKIQYDIVKILANTHGNIFAVGDEDQSIYGWRGASIDNIKLYLKEFNAKLYKLEQNYRSTKPILDIANKVIENNTTRIPKSLWTDINEGTKPEYYSASSDVAEADYVVGIINRLVHNYNVDPNEIAILMRVNAFSRNFEKRLVAYNIPHIVRGGFKFFDRKEIKDILAYFRLAINPQDNDAFVRALHFPKKGIGETSITTLHQIANLSKLSLYEIILDINFYPNLSKSLTKKLIAFGEVLKEIISNANIPLKDFVIKLYEILDIKNIYNDNSEDSYTRLLNLEEFANDIAEKTKFNPQMSLEEFLDTVTLYADEDIDDSKSNAVTISTIHSAKGLEYEIVFVVGCEEDIFPIKRSRENLLELEEERRLMYVAITRAKRRLYLTSCKSRFMYDGIKDLIPSRFLNECELIPKHNKIISSNINSKFTRTLDDNPNKLIKPQGNHIANYVKNSNNTKDFSKYTIGVSVNHRKFGKGIILSLSGTKDYPYAEINFEKVGTLTLSLAYAPLD